MTFILPVRYKENIMSIFIRRLEWFCGHVAGTLIVVISMLALWQVFSRYILNSPSTVTEESLRYLMIWMGFFGSAYCFGKNKHLSLTLIEDKVSKRTKFIMKIVQNIIVNITIFLALIYGGFNLVISSIDQRSSTLNWSMSLIYLIMPLSGIFIVIMTFLNLLEHLGINKIIGDNIENCDHEQ